MPLILSGYPLNRVRNLQFQESSVGIGFALVIAGAGLAMMLFVAVSRTGLNAPLWVVEVSLSAFVFAGASFAGQAMGWSRFVKICSLSTVYALATPGLWIMFASGAAQCAATNGFLSFMASNLECRIVFGIGGVFTLSYALAMTYVLFRKTGP